MSIKNGFGILLREPAAARGGERPPGSLALLLLKRSCRPGSRKLSAWLIAGFSGSSAETLATSISWHVVLWQCLEVWFPPYHHIEYLAVGDATETHFLLHWQPGVMERAILLSHLACPRAQFWLWLWQNQFCGVDMPLNFLLLWLAQL